MICVVGADESHMVHDGHSNESATVSASMECGRIDRKTVLALDKPRASTRYNK